MEDEIYEDIEFLDKIYSRGIINLTSYIAIKSAVIDYYLGKNKKENTENDDLPF